MVFKLGADPGMDGLQDYSSRGGQMTTASPIRIVIADSHQLFRAGLRLILSGENGIALVGETAHWFQTFEVVTTLQPDVLLLDTTLPGLDGIDALRPLRHKSPATKPLLLTSAQDEGLIFKGLRAGAKGCLSRDATLSDLTKAIQAVHEGQLWVDRKLIARFVEQEAGAELRQNRRGREQDALTTREEEILRLLASGGTNKDIGQALFISEKTVKSHVHNIFQKLNVTRRLQAILYAVNRGLR